MLKTDVSAVNWLLMEFHSLTDNDLYINPCHATGTFIFLIFSGNIEINYWHEMG